MTILILKNVLLFVPQTMSFAKNRITASVRRVTANMPLVNARPAAPVMIIPTFPRAMFRTARPAWIVTARPNIKSNPIPATDLWTVERQVQKTVQTPASPAPPQNTTTANPAPTKGRSLPVLAPIPAPLKNAPADTTNPAVNLRIPGILLVKPALAVLLTSTLVPAPAIPAVPEAFAMANMRLAGVRQVTTGAAAPVLKKKQAIPVMSIKTVVIIRNVAEETVVRFETLAGHMPAPFVTGVAFRKRF